MRRQVASFGLFLLLGTVSAACGNAVPSEGGQEAEPVASAVAAVATSEPVSADGPVATVAAELTVLGEAARGAPMLVATVARPPAKVRDAHGRVLIVADEDGDAVRVMDATSGEVVSETAMTGGPTQVLAASGGRVLVALRRESAVAVMALSEELGMVETQRVKTAEEPVALAFGEEHVLVVSGFGHTLEGFEVEGLQKQFEVDLPREPRSVVVTGGHAFVSHMVGSTVSDVDLQAEPPQRSNISLAGADVSSCCGCFCSNTYIPRAAVQGFAMVESEGRLWMPLAFSRSNSEATAGGYGSGLSSFAQVDAAMLSIDVETRGLIYRVEDTVFTNRKLRERTNVFGGVGAPKTSQGKCLLPRAVAAVPSSRRMLVSCLGSDEVVEVDGADKGFLSATSRTFRVPSGPVALAVDDARGEAFVWSAFDRAVSVLALRDAKSGAKDKSPAVAAKAGAPTRKFEMPALAGEDAVAARGRKLFHTTFDKRISVDGRACASCHPDGRDDGLVWSSPRGPLQTPMLAGRLAETAPYGWVGDARTVGEHLGDTLKRLGGTGLPKADVEALVAYVTALSGPTRQAAVVDARVAHGKELFESLDTMCTICHTQGGKGTDGARHDVGSGMSLETPTLRFVAGTAPYFHDGRYATLRDLLKGSSGKMGGSLDKLGDQDLDALEAYLRTL